MNTISSNSAWREKKEKGLAVCKQIRELANGTPFKKPAVKQKALSYWENELKPLFNLEKEQISASRSGAQALPQHFASLLHTDHELIARVAERIELDGDAKEIYLHFANLTEQHLVFGSKYVF